MRRKIASRFSSRPPSASALRKAYAFPQAHSQPDPRRVHLRGRSVAMPWLFRKTGIGRLVGKRTWGGLVGHYTNPGDLIYGGFTGTPDLAFYTPEGKWDVENHGVQPDFEVDLDPKLWRQGHDSQLEKAVQVVMDLLNKNEMRPHTRPPFPNYHTGGKQ